MSLRKIFTTWCLVGTLWGSLVATGNSQKHQLKNLHSGKLLFSIIPSEILCHKQVFRYSYGYIRH